jgi:hypothetical protein
MVNNRIEIEYDKLDPESAKAAVFACSSRYIFRYCDPSAQAKAVADIKADKAAKKAAAAEKKASEAQPKEAAGA